MAAATAVPIAKPVTLDGLRNRIWRAAEATRLAVAATTLAVAATNRNGFRKWIR